MRNIDELIENAIEEYGFCVPYDGSSIFYDKERMKHFRAGIQWAIDNVLNGKNENIL